MQCSLELDTLIVGGSCLALSILPPSQYLSHSLLIATRAKSPVGKGGQSKKHDTTTGNHMTSFSYVLISNSDSNCSRVSTHNYQCLSYLGLIKLV